MLSDDAEALICKFLVSSAVADHLGDIRNSEVYLWKALGIDPKWMRELDSYYDDSPFEILKLVWEENPDLPFEEWVKYDG